MPQSNRVVREFDLRHDMAQYYRRSHCTYVTPTGERLLAWIHEFTGDSSEVLAQIRTIGADQADYSPHFVVPIEALDFTVPYLGLVQDDVGAWFQLVRQPARRMRKGYNEECVSMVGIEDGPPHSNLNLTNRFIAKQVWYGNENRITNNIVVWNKGIYYMTDRVAEIRENQIHLIPNKEKLGEYTCKLLANNWESVISKHSGLMLPSSVQTG